MRAHCADYREELVLEGESKADSARLRSMRLPPQFWLAGQRRLY
jgi:hypothetical protein